MEMFINIEINIIGLAIILIVTLNMPLKLNKILFDQKIFLLLIFITSFIMMLDIIQLCLDGKPGIFINGFLNITEIMFFCICPLPCVLYSLYSYFQINRNSIKTKRLLFFLMPPVILISILSILSPFYHFLFYIDANNVYHRGNYINLLVLICLFYIIITAVYAIRKRNDIKSSDFHALLIFALPPTVGGILQTLLYGTNLLWVCVAMSILIVYIKIQNSNIYTDYLTGLSNRRQLDIYLHEMMSRQTKKNLAGMMIDINDFKEINDLNGHDHGDQALKYTSKILKKSFGNEDFIARYGGDEFVIIFSVKSNQDMEQAYNRIKKHTDEFNNMKKATYKLSFSVGYDIFDPSSEMTSDQFLKHIDLLMYENKKNQKNIKSIINS